VFHSVGPSGDLTLALLPQENSIFGIVTETYDLLRASELGESKWIRGTVTLSVQHCLVVRRGKTMRDIKRVLSHEQVRIFLGVVIEVVVRMNLTPPCIAQPLLAGLGTVSTIPYYAPA
jgi:Prephenate dehydratase